MSQLSRFLPAVLVLSLLALAWWIGPIAQPAAYHAFADEARRFGLPHAADVLSNAVFAAVALRGWLLLAPRRCETCLADGWPGYALFLCALFLTALGSAYYHLAPDNARLVWDRLPIALACAGLLAGVRGDVLRRNALAASAGLALYALGSVAWWHLGEMAGRGDLRPYLLLQLLPLLLIPLWQGLHGVASDERRRFAVALACYALAKVAEHFDHRIADALHGALTGHTVKHLLAGLAAWLIVRALAARAEGRTQPSACAKGISKSALRLWPGCLRG